MAKARENSNSVKNFGPHFCMTPLFSIWRDFILNWVSTFWIDNLIRDSAGCPITCSIFSFHFLSPSSPLPVHLGLIDGHMRCPINQFYKKNEFLKIRRQTYGQITSKDPFHIYARDLKNQNHNFHGSEILLVITQIMRSYLYRQWKL